jgi:MFS family permease
VFAPFRHRIFLAIWLASLVSNFGSLIQGVGASWLMTSIAPSPDMVSLVQVSTSLPIMLFSLLAGAIADVWDRRLVMLAAQGLMLSVSAALAALSHLGLITPWLLLSLTFLLGCGAALQAPAWQSSVGEQVPRADLPGAVALNSLGFNIARAVAPALGGLVVAAAGPQAAFLLNACSYVALIVVLLRWRRPVAERELPPENIAAAIGAGVRYARLSPRIGAVLARAGLFGLGAAAVWALLPLIARERLGGGAQIYGLLLGAFGLGAVGGALLSPRLRDRLSTEQLVRAACLLFALCSACTGLSRWTPLTLLGLLAGGAGWVLALSSFNLTVQLASPRWVVGRTIAVHQMVTFAGLALGSWMWGQVAEAQGLAAGLMAGAGLMALTALAGLRLPLSSAQDLDVQPFWPSAKARVHTAIDHRTGPIVTTIEYRVPPENLQPFVTGMRELRRIRRRDGGRAWALMRDIDDDELWIERFESPTWLEHLRRRARLTVSDREVLERVRACHVGAEPPRIRFLLERPPAALAALARETAPSLRAGASDPNMPSAALLQPRG